MSTTVSTSAFLRQLFCCWYILNCVYCDHKITFESTFFYKDENTSSTERFALLIQLKIVFYTL